MKIINVQQQLQEQKFMMFPYNFIKIKKLRKFYVLVRIIKKMKNIANTYMLYYYSIVIAQNQMDMKI